MVESLTVALWVANLAAGWREPGAFLEAAERQMARARAAGAELLLMPEHLGEAWLAWAPEGLAEREEIAWIAAEAEALLPALRAAARRHGLALLAGTVPVRIGPGRYRNRAHLQLPEGPLHVQDKLTLTPDERDPAAWTLEPGDRLRIRAWRGLEIAILICLDVEQPGLAARLRADPPDLLLVPTDTAAASGHARVMACARARAVELGCAVAVVGGVGSVPRPPARPNVSGAAVLVPCETGLGSTGVWAELGPLAATTGDGPLLVARDVPVGALRRLRAGGAEVWPGFRAVPPEALTLELVPEAAGPAPGSEAEVDQKAQEGAVG
jgi:predicted amidohydrolase